MRLSSVLLAAAVLHAVPSAAAVADGGVAPATMHVTFADNAPPATVAVNITFETAPSVEPAVAPQDQQPASARPVAFEYSHGYEIRNRIHHIASFAMLPLFGGEAYVGQKMFNHPDQITPSLRHMHGTLAASIAGLFAVNTVTGIWNLVEGRKDPHQGMLPVIHGVLMLVADAGFLATAVTHPNSRSSAGLAVYDPKKNQHMALAYASISTATVGYVIMLFRH